MPSFCQFCARFLPSSAVNSRSAPSSHIILNVAEGACKREPPFRGRDGAANAWTPAAFGRLSLVLSGLSSLQGVSLVASSAPEIPQRYLVRMCKHFLQSRFLTNQTIGCREYFMYFQEQLWRVGENLSVKNGRGSGVLSPHRLPVCGSLRLRFPLSLFCYITINDSCQINAHADAMNYLHARSAIHCICKAEYYFFLTSAKHCGTIFR